MKLIGRYGSPFVRRVGISMHAHAIPFQLVELSPYTQADDIRRSVAIGRVPALVLENGETLIESGAILDYLDEQSGGDKMLLPEAGEDRRQSLRIVATATAAVTRPWRSARNGGGRQRRFTTAGSTGAASNWMQR